MSMQSQPDLSERELEQMERRSQAASPAPWVSWVVGRDLEAGLNCIELGDCAAMEVIGASVADQDFIANAREDVPRLVTEVRQLRAELQVRSMLVAALRPASSNAESAGLLA